MSEADLLSLGRLTTGLAKVTPSLAEERRKQMEKAGADKGGAWDGENPGPDNSAGDAPADGGKAAGGADTDDGAGDGVGGADGDAESGVHHEGKAAGSFRRKTTEGCELGDALAHGSYDAPAAGHGAASHG